MMTRRIFFAVAQEAIPDMRYWLSLNETAEMPHTIRDNFELPISLVHTQSGMAIKAVSGWVSYPDGSDFVRMMQALPASLKPFVRWAEGQTDINPAKPTFNEWLAEEGLARV